MIGRRTSRGIVAALVAGLVATALGTAPAAAAPPTADDHRVVAYYQTQVDGDRYVSPKPLGRGNVGATDIIVAAIHLNERPGDLTLNDHVPSHPRYDRMWKDLRALQHSGVRILGMVGGAAPGTFTRLDADFDRYYPALREMVETYGLDGLDLDVEEPMSLEGIVRLIDQLRADFGEDFVITLTPVAAALQDRGNMSGFSYDELWALRADDIDWFNAQFYCGWGTLATTAGYDAIIERGYPADKVVAIALTDPGLCGGYVDVDTLQATFGALAERYDDFGGIAGWEYFISQPGGKDAPWQWFQLMHVAIS